MAEYTVDYQAMIQQMKDHIALELITILNPDKESAQQMIEIMEIFNRHGVSVETALKIFMDLDPVLKKYSNKKENDEK